MNSIIDVSEKDSIENEQSSQIYKPVPNKFPSNYNTRIIYKEAEEELKRVEIEKNVYVRVLKIGKETYVDIRRFFREYPTKKGIRLPYETFVNLKSIL